MFQNSLDTITERYHKRLTAAHRVAKYSWQVDKAWLKESTLLWPKETPWQPAQKWYQQLKSAFETRINVKLVDLPQVSGATLSLELQHKNKKTPFIIDIADSVEIKEAAPSNAQLYFKMQFKNQGYKDTNVIPGGYLTNSADVYHHLKKLRTIKDTQDSLYQVYGRFSLQFAKETRKKALEILGEQKKFSFEGSPKKIRYSRFLKESAKADILIDLPGNGPLCFRLLDYLSIGGCIIAPRHRAKLHVPLEHMKHIVYVKPDLSDLTETCHSVLQDKALLKEITKNSRDFFDAYLHREQLISYYLHNMMLSLT